MTRLADYFAIVGFDHERESGGESVGKILQRFPETNWEETAFIEGIEVFCQPQGWSLSQHRQEPKYFVSVLTDIDAKKHYCACLSFVEPITGVPEQNVDEEEDGINTNNSHQYLGSVSKSSVATRQNLMYAPKCLVLISRVDYFETFRNCLGIMYTAYIDNMAVQIETLVANILGSVQIPPPGGPQVRFSIGAGDRQALQPPLSSTLPVTGTSVYNLFQDLGIYNVLKLFCAALLEQKILFYSQSYRRLNEASLALCSLLYPMKYVHVYIPILPASLIEILTAPTPFIMGVHSCCKSDTSDLIDVISADLDGGFIHVPESVVLPSLMEPVCYETQVILSRILRAELTSSDYAFPPSKTESHSADFIDKQIRAVFIRLFAQLLQGYRKFLTIIRIHPEPVITFQKAGYLGYRLLSDCDFTPKLLDCMCFTSFVQERGPPWRSCDIWDEVYSLIGEWLETELRDPNKVMMHINNIAEQLNTNEHPNSQLYVQKIPRPTDGAYTRIHLPTFPLLDAIKVRQLVEEKSPVDLLKTRLPGILASKCRIVPMGPIVTTATPTKDLVDNSTRRLEVLKNCINCIFENKISDARKTFPAVLKALKSKVARLALCSELSQHVIGNKATLEMLQFDLVIKLINRALQEDSPADEYGVAASILPLCTALCRKLCTGVIQFAYTCIQDHLVWNNLQFWEAAFFQDVQKEIKALYLLHQDKFNVHNYERGFREFKPRSRIINPVNPPEASPMEIAAEQMRLWPSIPEDTRKEMIKNEESTVYSQAIHFANRMVYLRVPLDTSNRKVTGIGNNVDSLTNSFTNSELQDNESGFEEEEEHSVVKFVSRFVDKVCTLGGVTSEHIKCLHQMIPGVVAMHIETLDAVGRESKRLPPVQKPKILSPSLLNKEDILVGGLRAYLVPDGREEVTGHVHGGPTLLPSEGALFITNYRVIFKGTPIDAFASEQVVVRCFPIMALTKEKKISVQYLPHLDQWLSEGLQFRSSTFQLIKVAFDEEVTNEMVENVRKHIQRYRHPVSIDCLYAFAGHGMSNQAPLLKDKTKNSTLRGMAKKTLIKTARKAGLRTKSSNKYQKYILTSNIGDKYKTSPGRMSLDDFMVNGRPQLFINSEEVNEDIDNRNSSSMYMHSVYNHSNPRLNDKSYYKDYLRLNLIANNKNSHFRVSNVNETFNICRSYPAMVIVPCSVSDPSLERLSRFYRNGRFPCITWRHSRNGGLLLRGAGFHTKSVMGMLKHNPGSTGNQNETPLSVEQEKFISSIISCTPFASIKPQSWNMGDSNLSINSLMVSAGEAFTPDLPRKSRNFTKVMASLRDQTIFRTSGGKGSKSKLATLKDKDDESISSLNSLHSWEVPVSNRYSVDGDVAVEGVQTLNKAALYVFGDKAQIKTIKPDNYPKCDFIPLNTVEVRQTKLAFKKLMRACVPSAPMAEPEQTFNKAIEDSEWLLHIRTIMLAAGAVVDLIDLQGSSVMLCLEDGWDITTQISSLSQVCLDPYYRTIEGFRTLVEKEWLSFGHKFSHRSGHDESTQSGGFAPIFLQFLDCVHQVMNQFPLSFEFNDYYLRFLAYHVTSCRFNTFLLDSDLERNVSFSADHLSDDDNNEGTLTAMSNPMGTTLCAPKNSLILSSQCIFDYIEKQNYRRPLFYNFIYSSSNQSIVLRPSSSLISLKIWQYYTIEELAHGCPYEPEIIQLDSQREEEIQLTEGTTLPQSARKVMLAGYDNLISKIPDSFTQLLSDIWKLETELGYLPQNWRTVIEKLDLPDQDSMSKQMSSMIAANRYHGRSAHKRATVEFLVRGKMLGGNETPQIYSHPHRFEKYNFSTPTYCDFCSNLLWGLVKTGLRCVDCGYNCHEKCMENVPKNCTKYKARLDSGGSPKITNQQAEEQPQSTIAAPIPPAMNQATSQQYYHQFSSNVAENRTHEGFLFKRGALLKAWKQRWFVLDSMKHQLRYYDAADDSHCKGFIDLADVVSVNPSCPTPGAPKKVDAKAFFDLRTMRRSYNFCAVDASAAQEWIEKIQACL